MFDQPYKCGMCVFGCLGICCCITSIGCLIAYIKLAEQKEYAFLGEVAMYTVLLSFLFMVIRANIYQENKNNPVTKTKSTKVIPFP